MQRYLFITIRAHGKPITFAELRRVAIDPQIGFLSFSQERSLRRALHSMVRDKALIALGSGGRGDPHRYFLDPMLVAMTASKPQFDAAMAALEGDAKRTAES